MSQEKTNQKFTGKLLFKEMNLKYLNKYNKVLYLRIGNFYQPKYQIWCNSDVPWAQDPSLPI